MSIYLTFISGAILGFSTSHGSVSNFLAANLNDFTEAPLTELSKSFESRLDIETSIFSCCDKSVDYRIVFY